MKLKSTIQKLLLMGLMTVLAGSARADGESVLWWMVDSWGDTPMPTVTLSDGSVVSVEGYVSGDGYLANAARVYAIDSNGNKTALHFFYDSSEDGESTTWTLNGTDGMLYDDSVTPQTWSGQGWTPADLTQLGSNVATYSFMMELGNLTGDNVWTTLATSEVVAYNDLTRYISTLGVSTQGQVPWAPNFVVPEPSSGLLLLIGSALLTLRRRRRQ